MELISGNIFIRPNKLLPKGHVIHGHKHTFDHTTFVIDGSIHVKRMNLDGSITEQDFKKGDHFLTKKDIEHEITSLQDDTTYYCVFSHRNSQGDIVQVFEGWHEY